MNNIISGRGFINLAGIGTIAITTMNLNKYIHVNSGKGIGMPYVFPEDMTRTGASWFYNWGMLDPMPEGFVPMSWKGEDPQLPADYSGYILLFNEPDRPEQANITPEVGLVIYRDLRREYPLAKFVVGNVYFMRWLIEFRDLCQGIDVPEYWGLHCYVGKIEYLQRMLDYLNEAHDILGGTFWITEFAGVFGDVSVDDKLVRFFEAHDWIDRYAIFCNRAKGDEWWYPKGWDVRLFDFETGNPTHIGEWYTNGLHQTFIPMVQHGTQLPNP